MTGYHSAATGGDHSLALSEGFGSSCKRASPSC